MEQPTTVSNILTWDKLLKNEQLRLAQQMQFTEASALERLVEIHQIRHELNGAFNF